MATPSVGTASLAVRGDFRPFDRQMSRFAITSRSRFAKVGKGIGLGLVAGLGAAGFAAKKAFGEFQEAEKATRQTRAALKSTGAVAGITAKQIESLANAISLKAGIDDEAIQSSENLLLTFTKVRDGVGKGNKIFDQATQAITDMAAAMAAGSGGTPDLKGATIQVGKALQDPIKGITALRRVGVNFDEQTSNRIKLWVEQGKQMKAQKFILKELGKEFGGSAAAQATGTQKLGVAVKQVEESLGKLFGPLVEKGATKLAKFVDEMLDGTGAGGRFAEKIKAIGKELAPIARFAGRAGKAVGEFVGNHPQLAAMAVSATALGVAFNKLKIGKGLAAVIALIRGGKGLASGGGLGGVLSSAKPVPVFVTNPGFAGAPGKGPGGPVAAPGPGSRVPVPSGPKTPFDRLPAGVKGGIGATAIGLGAIKITSDFFKDHSDLGLLDQFASQIERVAKAGDAPGMRSLAKDLRDTADANKDLTKGTHLRAFADELDRTAASGGKSIKGIASLFDKLPRSTGGDLDKVGHHLSDVGGKSQSVFKSMQQAAKRLGGQTDVLADKTGHYGKVAEGGRHRSDALGGSFKRSGFNAFGAGKNVQSLIAKIEALPSHKTVSLDVFTKFFRQSRGAVAGLFREGGMVPAMLSPGEVGITPGGGRFKVPGARVAADSVPSMVPSGTAILTASGQRMERRGVSLGEIVRKQLPHFRKGGIANAKDWARAQLDELKIRRSATSIYDLDKWATIEGGHWHNSAKFNPLNTTLDKPGARSINSIGVKAYRSWPQGLDATGDTLHNGRYGRILSALKHGTFGQFKSAVLASPWGTTAMPGGPGPKPGTGIEGPGGMRVTPAPISHPILSTQLRPLIDDALAGGIQAGMDRTGHAGRVDLLQSVLEGIVPDSGDRATRERIKGAAGVVGPRIVKFMKARASAIDAKHFPYSSPGNRSFGTAGPMDCSGGTSKVIGPNLLPAVEVSGFFKTWGQAGKGKHLTTYAKGTVGADGHVFLNLDGRDWGTSSQNPAGGAGWFTADPSYRAQFIARHPKGLRRGGMVGDGAAQKIFQRLPKRFRSPKVLAEIKAGGVLPGMRAGGIVGPDFDFATWLRKLRKQGRKPSLSQLVGLLGADQLGSANADKATRVLARRVAGRSTGALVKTQNRIRNQIRRMAKHGFTGPERIRTRRLRGGLSLVQDELGRPIGRALGRSDRLQDLISRNESTLSDRLTVMGIDPDSRQGLQAQQTEAKGGLVRLVQRRAELQKALKRARKSGNKEAVKTVQAELADNQDDITSLKASIINLDKSMKEAAESGQADLLQQLVDLAQQQKDLQTEANDRQKRIETAVNSQGPALQTLLAGILDGGIGGKTGLGRSFPSFSGLGGLARA